MAPNIASPPRAQGLEAVYLNQRDALVRFLRARGAGELAEDLVQELWLRVSTTSLEPIGDPAGYLFRAAHNLMISHHRSAVRSMRRDDEWMFGNQRSTSGEAFIEARQQIAIVADQLRALGDRPYRVFVMFRVDGVPQKEIAARFGLSVSAVEKDLQRAYRTIAGLKEPIDDA